ncbi:MAG: glutamate-5-semialdehyde dehydrogenase [Leptolyngbya sp. DLM2.Bin15]|nr:MAG: glutamate-5-semialdehyde dehydrogenase [Leptolyngbya sp. DLM2.Bin15]
MAAYSSISSPDLIPVITQRAHEASLELLKFSGSDRSRALQAMAKGIKAYKDDLLEANTLDLEASREMAVPELILDWLKLTPERLQTAIAILQRLSDLPDPLQQVQNPPYAVAQGQTYCQLMPLGVVALVYEAFPELGAIAAGMCVRTANSLILKGGSEASQSNHMFASILQSALEQVGLPTSSLEALPSDCGDLTHELVTCDRAVNLVIPYGRASLVQQVMRQATAPVLKTAIGNCYLYWSPSAGIDLVRWMILDSHASEPDPVNAIEKVLIHRNHLPSSLSLLWGSLLEKGYELKGDEELAKEFPELSPVAPTEWRQPYLNRTIAFKWVRDLDDAIAWMNRYSSGHADCLATESYQESRLFASQMASATVYINASSRFYRNPKFNLPIALGMSNHKGHRRGFISLEALTTVKQIIQGNE